MIQISLNECLLMTIFVMHIRISCSKICRKSRFVCNRRGEGNKSVFMSMSYRKYGCIVASKMFHDIGGIYLYTGRNWAGIATIVQVMTTFLKLDFLLDYKLDISKITANKIFDNSNCSFA